VKHINFEVFLRRNFNISREIKQSVLYRIGDLKVFDIEHLEVEEDGFTKEVDEITICLMKDIIGFTILFVYNIINDNRSIKRKKEELYKIDIKLRIDFKGKKLQIHYYLDDNVFGIVVGKQFQNIRSFIQACFPIIAKSEFKMEFRFFPISRK
jgi:hypothetical protein